MGPQFAFGAAICVLVVAEFDGIDTIVALPLAMSAGVIVMVLYWYSPLPNHNGGWGHSPAQRQQWGFTSEPADDAPEPDGNEALSYRPNLFGIYTTDNQPEETE